MNVHPTATTNRGINGPFVNEGEFESESEISSLPSCYCQHDVHVALLPCIDRSLAHAMPTRRRIKTTDERVLGP